jgi:segregation and condensation protein B
VTGHRETLGRPPLYGTTQTFLRTFGLKTLGDLPSIEELRALVPAESAPQGEPSPATEEAEEPSEEADQEIEDTLENGDLREVDGVEATEDEEDFEDEDGDGENEDENLSR